VICRATEELAARLREVQRLVDEGNGAAMQRSARLLIRVAEQVGMLTFARVAGDVLRATDAGDASAQAATL
jgi:pyrroloquinoline quinone (PQQ) biosynthesis protein C